MDLDLIDRGSMACPALPTCGLAVTESERGLPDVNARLRALLTRLGFDDSDAFVVRMTGAPGLPTPPVIHHHSPVVHHHSGSRAVQYSDIAHILHI